MKTNIQEWIYDKGQKLDAKPKLVEDEYSPDIRHIEGKLEAHYNNPETVSNTQKTLHSNIVSHLQQHGYDNFDFNSKTTSKPIVDIYGNTKRNPINITKALSKTKAPKTLLDTFNNMSNSNYLEQKVKSFNGTEKESEDINKYLHAKHHNSEVNSPYYDDKVAEVDNALETHSKPAPFDFHVFTGLSSSVNVSEHRNNGNSTMDLPHYTSTSIDPHTAISYAIRGNTTGPKEVIRIKIPKDSTNGTFLGKSSRKNLQEFIIKRNMRLRFVGEPRQIKVKHNPIGNSSAILFAHQNPNNEHTIIVHHAELEPMETKQ